MKEIESKYDNLIVSGAKLNFQTFPNLILTKKDLSFIHFISSIISNGYLKKINFYNASLLGTKFSNVTFENCNMTSTDIFSVWFKDCSFINSDLSESSISDSTFINCVFNNSIFNSISLTNCQFIDCVFEQLPIDDSNFSLNTFVHCKIKNTSFTESFYYQLFNDCEFHNVNMPSDLLGYNFGFSKEVLQQLSNNVDLQEIEMNFINKGFFVNAAILRINQVQEQFDTAIVACIAALSQMLKQDILIKADEIKFLKELTIYFVENNKIAPISIIKIWQILNKFVNSDINNIAIDKARPHINEYINDLYFYYQDFLEKLQNQINSLSQDTDSKETVELKVVYSEKPTIPLFEFLSEITDSIAVDCQKPRFIRAEKGSFKEFHEIATIIIPYLQTFFGLLGIVIPIYIYRKQRKDKEVQEKTKNIESIEIELSEPKISQSIILPNTNIITPETGIIVADTIKILNNQPIIDNEGFCGYNHKNIKSINIKLK